MAVLLTSVISIDMIAGSMSGTGTVTFNHAAAGAP